MSARPPYAPAARLSSLALDTPRLFWGVRAARKGQCPQTGFSYHPEDVTGACDFPSAVEI